jgi:hypothetical protein
MKKDDVILTAFFVLLLALIAKTANISYDPRTMGILGLIFFVIVFALALK